MNVVKSYSDARKELERIAAQRQNFFNNSKRIRNEMSTDYTPQKSETNINIAHNNGAHFSGDRYSILSPRLYSSNNNPSPSKRSPMSHNGYSQHNVLADKSSSSSYYTSNNSQTPAALYGHHLEHHTSPHNSSHASFNTPHHYSQSNMNGFASTTDNGMGPSSVSVGMGLGSASSVIGAFRQLQARSRIIEQERSDAYKER